MRILIGTESFPPVLSGVSIVTERLARELTQRGHQVLIVTGSKDRRFHTTTTHGYTVKWLPTLPNPFRKGLRLTVRVRHRLEGIIEEFKPDIIHIHDPGRLCYSLVNEGEGEDIPVVVTHHFMLEGLLPYLSWLKPAHPLVEGVIERYLVKLYNRCATIIVPTETMRSYLDPWGNLSTPRRVISNGVDLEQFQSPANAAAKVKARQLWNLPADGIVLGYSGRIDPEKNLPILIKALASLPEAKRPQVLVVGNGNSVKDCQELAQKLKVATIHWHSPVSYYDKKMTAFYQAIDVFCIPSKAETESMGTMEAMASGLPILASNAGALPELVSEENGRLLDPDDAQEWAEAIQELTSDPALLKNMGTVSRAGIQERSLPVMIKELEALYLEIIK